MLTTGRSQAAVMRLAPGSGWSGEKSNRHPQSDQVLFVVRGEVVAEIGDERETLHEGDVVIVEAGAPHRFGNESKEEALTFNVYTPPAY
ncbi:MAG: cupin domain-containing protein [Candidatus Eremiobacteraeota bacterium]|nr:cupin domain-containing protein [Candidatus Eremiobacteraeota bacterium]